MLFCRVLGPLEIVADGARVDPGGPQPRRLTEALIAARGEAVSEDRLTEAIWGDTPPANPSASLQAYVSRLRKAFGAGALTRGPGGYTLIADSDADEFRSGVERGLAAAWPGDALRHLDAALRLWRGRPYPDLDAFAEAERGRLTELRATAVEERAAALLALGDAPAAVTDLRPAVRDEPYRERRWELLILALYRSARQAEALSALREVRALLADDLGVDPGAELQSLERRLLAQDPSLLLAAKPARTGRPLSRFVGRATELGLLSAAMAETRLVTLVGPGGTGKTRLALEWAGDAYLARLADVRSPVDLPSVIAAALGLADTPSRITGAGGLLLLDNCEHLTDAVADLAVTLLADNPDLRVLATSREALGVDGERLLPIDPLPRADAVTLLTDRIAAVRPGWQPTGDDLTQLDRLASALDGIPLALELAAARARVLSLGELSGRHLSALGRVPRGALTPHATLEATVAWSVDLLPDRDRALFLRLWPFEGGFTLEGAAALGSDLAALSSLVSRSVVAADTTLTPARYRLLEIIRAYCRDHDPDPAGSRAAHAAWARELVARTVPDLRGRRSARAIRVLNRELPNLRAALTHDLAEDPAAALRTAGLLEWFWVRGGHAAEGLRLLTTAMDRAPGAPPVVRARALSACAGLHWIGGDLAEVRRCVTGAFDALGAPDGEDGRRLLGQLHYYRAMLWTADADFDRAADSARASIEVSRTVGEPRYGVLPQALLGGALAGRGEIAEGRRRLRAAIEEAERDGYGWDGGLAAQLLIRSLVVDDPEAAFPVLHRAITWFREEDDRVQVLSCLAHGALVLLRTGRPAAAVTLLTGADRLAARGGIRLDNADPTAMAMLRTEIAALDPDLRASAAAASEPLTEDDLIALLTGLQ
ncbi:BTAD domain-containing putative transcriptional regulator [Catenuloplanes atrovinosus]|uniref:ATPase/DNA-binding SARP family transcriptional activator n=1 Tax=Catenuloplanes atrovinosus TaxID=137266 RepID=A0AAE3YXA1_9ACTN|nr:BTAD domain-containing putative transcriptional regulator [Catenuloplanes atrovinosus]MDR7279591.1 putative ATPase/DNA-binding SARP family transcriptional activator [Catenuloplanes atrovinosus]